MADKGIEVIILHSVAGPNHLTFGKGEQVILPTEIALEWINTGLAERVQKKEAAIPKSISKKGK
jgi:hypothetical protein